MATYQAYSDARAADLLAAYHRTGDPRVRDEVVEHMRPLVQSAARKFAGREPLEDLESEGFVGLIRAVDRFKPERGTRFSTFAMHLIAGQIRHYLRDRGHLIRQPAWLQELDARVQRAAVELEQRLQRPPTIAEIAEATNLTEEGVEELIAARQAARILRLEVASSEEEVYLDVDPEKIRSRDYITFELPVEDRIVLEDTLEKLKGLERKVLYYFFYQDFTQSEIARKLGISCNYAGYVLRNGLKHMREGLPEERPPSQSRLKEDESVMDEATGTYTRDHFMRRLREEISRAQRDRKPVSVCCLRLTQESSDSVLQTAAGFLRGRTRKMDVLARMAVQEFGLIFPGTGTVALQVGRRLAEQLEAVTGSPVHMTAVIYPEDGRTAEELLAAMRDSLISAVRPVVAGVPAAAVG